MASLKRTIDGTNQTQVTFFLFSGLTDNEKLVPFLFTLFLVVYTVTVVGNSGMIALIHGSARLHCPMYYFLSYLSMVDLCYSSVVTPKMLSDLFSQVKSLSFNGCALQLFFFAGLAVIDALLLSSMSYDRYVAICHPLHYVSIMTRRRCLSLLLLATLIGFLQATAQTSCIFHLRFCGPNLLDHFYCDIPPLLRLSCSSTLLCDIVMVFFMCSCGIGSLVTVLVSYTLIISSILRMKSSEGRRKAFSTCSTHLTCVSMLYGTVFFIYLRPPATGFGNRDKVVSVFYTVMIPMLNPLIYSLRNQEVRRVIVEAMQKFHTPPS